MSYAQSLEELSHQVPPKRELPFLRNPKLRAMAERDLASLVSHRKYGELMSAVIMGGRVVEGVLLDCFHRLPDTVLEDAARRIQVQRNSDGRFNNFSPGRIENWSFIHYIAVAGPEGLNILGQRTERMADNLRHFRNLVHPARELKEAADRPLRASEADAVEAFLRTVLDDVEAWVMTR